MDIDKLKNKLEKHIVLVEFTSLKSGETKRRELTLCEKYMHIPNHISHQTGDRLVMYDVEFQRWEDVMLSTITNWKVIE